jgi:hypothetical protein
VIPPTVIRIEVGCARVVALTLGAANSNHSSRPDEARSAFQEEFTFYADLLEAFERDTTGQS